MTTAAKVSSVASANVAKICGTAKANIKYVMGVGVGPSIALIDSYASSNISNDYDITSYQTHIGQAIRLAAPKTITSVKVYMKKTAAISGNLQAEIYGCTGTPGSTGKATGSALATSGTYDANNLTSTLAELEFTFSGGYSASGDIVVAIAASFSSGTAYIGYDASSPTHAGNACVNAGGWYTMDAYLGGTNDLCFELYGY